MAIIKHTPIKQQLPNAEIQIKVMDSVVVKVRIRARVFSSIKKLLIFHIRNCNRLVSSQLFFYFFLFF